MADDDKLPAAPLQQLLKELLPPHVKVAPEARDVLLACCNEFFQMVSTEAHATSERAKSKSIDPAHVLKALEELGMPDLAAQCSETAEADKAQQKGRAEVKRGKTLEARAKSHGMSLADLEAAQAAMFAQAREEYQRQLAGVDGASAP